jgi:predicted metal-dependent phosphoesterase TrpH
MMRRAWIPIVLLVSIAAGSVADQPPDRQPIVAGPYRVLSADFHLHSGLGSGGTLTPWGLVTEAQRQRLDVIALAGHNQTWDSHVARVFTRFVDGPIVLVGEEVTSRTQDLIAIGIQDTISPSLSLREQIEAVHRQGGLAIAAHPGERFGAAYQRAGVMALLDGTEVCHPIIYGIEGSAKELADFAAGTGAMPIGSSDFHWSGRVGSCRTFIFVDVDRPNDRGVMDALRAHRTVVYGLNGRAFGDPALVRLADAAGLRDVAAGYWRDQGGVLDWISRLTAGAGLLGIAFVTRSLASRRAAARPGYGRLAPMPPP